ncbi:PREDICTED: uncharacterized protein LOC108362321 [Rhagoletis zephyria]|uniref:uncharacterized protein LOC108362321 n=1 Tax=Rhagoletis zephyria TaxID=28612 RepID=UPI0008112F34|nr:PREDICTED: uncharacterized protein LOC108362321 [Rhagoletis zephyria]
MEKEGIDVDKHDFHREDDEASLKDKDKEEVAGSSNDVEQTSAKLEEQGKAPCASTAIDMNMLLGAISQISSQLQVQETRMSSQLDEKITQLQENLFKNNSELRERQDKIEERQDNRTKSKLRWMSLKIVSGRINDEQCATEDAAFAAKFKRNEFKSESKPSIDELKRKTKCNACGQIGHWAKDKKCPKSKNSSSINKSKKRASSKDNKSLKDRDELAWSTVVRANKYDDSKSNYWCVDSGATSHMTYRREWFSELREYGGQVKLADRRHVEIRGIGTVLIDS